MKPDYNNSCGGFTAPREDRKTLFGLPLIEAIRRYRNLMRDTFGVTPTLLSAKKAVEEMMDLVDIDKNADNLRTQVRLAVEAARINNVPKYRIDDILRIFQN